MDMIKTKKKTKTATRFVVVGNGGSGYGWGLYYGETSATDAEILASKSIRLTNARNIRQWRGMNGGITSLAAHGPCGSRFNECRIGTPVPSALITQVVCVYDCTPEAVAKVVNV